MKLDEVGRGRNKEDVGAWVQTTTSHSCETFKVDFTLMRAPEVDRMDYID